MLHEIIVKYLVQEGKVCCVIKKVIGAIEFKEIKIQESKIQGGKATAFNYRRYFVKCLSNTT